MNTKTTEAPAARQTAQCEIPGCEGHAIHRGVCSPEHYRERADRRRADLLWAPRADAMPGPAPEPETFHPAKPIPSEQRVCDIPDAFDCEAEAMHRIGTGAETDFACGRHRFEVVAAHWKRNANPPIHDLDEGNGHVCNEVRKTVPGGAS